jgi:hypothetical protein
MPSGIFDFLSVRNYTKKNRSAEGEALPEQVNNQEGSAEGEAFAGRGVSHITSFTRRRRRTIRRLEELLNQIENVGINIHVDTGRDSGNVYAGIDAL